MIAWRMLLRRETALRVPDERHDDNPEGARETTALDGGTWPAETIR
jgi:hypothetical protein